VDTAFGVINQVQKDVLYKFVLTRISGEPRTAISHRKRGHFYQNRTGIGQKWAPRCGSCGKVGHSSNKNCRREKIEARVKPVVTYTPESNSAVTCFRSREKSNFVRQCRKPSIREKISEAIGKRGKTIGEQPPDRLLYSVGCGSVHYWDYVEVDLDVRDGLLGRDFLKKMQAQICYKSRTLTFTYAGVTITKPLSNDFLANKLLKSGERVGRIKKPQGPRR
jgi:hypothetical protein